MRLLGEYCKANLISEYLSTKVKINEDLVYLVITEQDGWNDGRHDTRGFEDDHPQEEWCSFAPAIPLLPIL